MKKVLGFLCYIKRLLGQMWKFHDTRSIHKTRMNHLKLPEKFLSSVLSLNRQLKVSVTKFSTFGLLIETLMFLVLNSHFIENSSYPLVPWPIRTLNYIILQLLFKNKLSHNYGLLQYNFRSSSEANWRTSAARFSTFPAYPLVAGLTGGGPTLEDAWGRSPAVGGCRKLPNLLKFRKLHG